MTGAPLGNSASAGEHDATASPADGVAQAVSAPVTTNSAPDSAPPSSLPPSPPQGAQRVSARTREQVASALNDDIDPSDIPTIAA